MKNILPLSLVILAFCLSDSLFSQSVHSREVNQSSKWAYFILMGAGISNEQEPQYEYYAGYDPNKEPEWYVPRSSASIGGGVSRNTGKFFRLSSGISYDYYSIRSEPFHVVHVGPGYYHTSTGIKPYITTDNELSVRQRHRGYVSVPLSFEYYGKRKWTPYFKVGTTFSVKVYDRAETVFVGTRQGSDGFSSNSIGAYSVSTLFGTFGGGLQCRSEKRTFVMGVAGNIGITSLNGSYSYPLPNSLRIEIGFRQQLK